MEMSDRSAQVQGNGIAVTNTLDVGTDDCADMAVGLLLATMLRICAADHFLRKGLWPKLGRYPIFTHKVLKVILLFVVC